MVLRWHTELEWLKMPPAHERIPRAHWQVSFMELALDFEAFAGRPLPPAPQSKFVGRDMSLQEKGTVLRLIVTLTGRATERESIFPFKMTHHCRSFTSMGAGTVMGLEGRRGNTWRGSAYTGRPDGHKNKKGWLVWSTVYACRLVHCGALSTLPSDMATALLQRLFAAMLTWKSPQQGRLTQDGINTT